jgi:hypothetical protein
METVITQVELYCHGDFSVRWLEYNSGAVSGPDGFAEDAVELKQGQRLMLVEESGRPWTILRIFVTLPSSCPLPPKARKATIQRILDEDGTADVKAAYPRVYVSV